MHSPLQAAASLATAFQAQDGEAVKKALGDLSASLATAFAPCKNANAEMTRLEAALAAMQQPLAFSFEAVRARFLLSLSGQGPRIFRRD